MSRTPAPSRRPARRAPRAVLAALTSLLLVTGCSALGGGSGPEPSPVGAPAAVPGEAASDPALARFYDQRLQWTGCQGGFECTRLQVPVDYADPAGATTTLALVRLATTATGEDRLGSLVLNPGGPGAGT
ncbi:alpha/beta hydrolase, partial [Kineococcus sp. R8]|nr:alpha/beta hydrolase [Kineococcus siccus]